MQNNETEEPAPPAPETGNAISSPEASATSPAPSPQTGAMTKRGKKSSAQRHPWLRRIGIAFLVLVGVVLASLVLFRFVNPPITSVMVIEKLRGETLKRRWVPIEKISPHMRLAVIASEDGNFCQHRGVDWAAVRQVLESAKNLEPARGASTIPMQVAKNIYLWDFRSYLRKALEVPLAYAIVTIWPKRRVLEVYLNIAQFGPGLFGVEAASQRYFRKPASALTQSEAVLLATTLPKPKLRNPARPNRTHRAVANAVQKRLPYIAKRADCILNP
jgi:monofunctional biosynthetic peptidoglycan transglycosylase